MAVLFFPKAQALRFVCTGEIDTEFLTGVSILVRGGATSYRGASPTLRVVFLCRFSKMLFSGCLTACCRTGSSSTSAPVVSQASLDNADSGKETVREDAVEAVEFFEELMGDISIF
jgi:hypothetical protein